MPGTENSSGYGELIKGVGVSFRGIKKGKKKIMAKGKDAKKEVKKKKSNKGKVAYKSFG